MIYFISEGSLEVKLPTIWTDEKQRWEESEKRREEKKKELSQKRKPQKKEDPGARKGRKVAKHGVFPMICGSRGSQSRLAKAAGAEPAGQMRDEKLHAIVARSTFRSQNVQNTPCSDHFWKLRCRTSARRCGAKHISKSKCTKYTILGPLLEIEMSKKCTPLWQEAHFEVKMCKTHHVRTTFGSWDVEQVHAVVARSIFRSQNVQNTPFSDHFWKLRCRKSARRCGKKHISKSRCAKHTMFGPLLEVEMSKKCTPLWREAHFQVKMLKATGVWTTFGRSDVVSRGRRKGLCTLSKVSKTCGFCSSFNCNHHYTTPHSNTLHYNYNYTFTTFHYATLHPTTLHYTTLHSITLNYTTLHYTTFHYTTLHYTTLHYTTLHYTTLHYTPLHYTTLHYTALYYTTLHYNYTALYYTTLQLHYTTFHYTTLQLHYTTFHYTTLHYTTFHYTTTTTTITTTTAAGTTATTTIHDITLHYTTTTTTPEPTTTITTTTTTTLH